MIMEGLFAIIRDIILGLFELFENGSKDKQKSKNDKNNTFEYPLVQKPIFSKREHVFFSMLREIALENGYYVLSKVKLIDLIETCKSVPNKQRFWQNNRIKELHLDYLLLSEKDYSVVCAIELDDKSHRSKKQIERDQKKDAAMSAANIPLVRIPEGWFDRDQVCEALMGVAL